MFFSKKPKKEIVEERHHDWHSLKEGDLLIDMYERADALVVRSHVAGVIPEALEVSVHNDLLTIRGMRLEPEDIPADQYYSRECVWGSFRRTVVIPIPVNPNEIRAYCNHGIITIELPKLSVFDDEDDDDMDI